jgi:hypothetical protein
VDDQSRNAKDDPASAREVELVGLNACDIDHPSRLEANGRRGGLPSRPGGRGSSPRLSLLSLIRTRQTLEAVEASLGKRRAVEVVPRLYAASEQELLERLQALRQSVGPGPA